MPTDIGRCLLRSSAPTGTQSWRSWRELAVEIQQCPLRSGAGEEARRRGGEEKRREEKRREEKRREGKGREGKGREEKRREEKTGEERRREEKRGEERRGEGAESYVKIGELCQNLTTLTWQVGYQEVLQNKTVDQMHFSMRTGFQSDPMRISALMPFDSFKISSRAYCMF